MAGFEPATIWFAAFPINRYSIGPVGPQLAALFPVVHYVTARSSSLGLTPLRGEHLADLSGKTAPKAKYAPLRGEAQSASIISTCSWKHARANGWTHFRKNFFVAALRLTTPVKKRRSMKPLRLPPCPESRFSASRSSLSPSFSPSEPAYQCAPVRKMSTRPCRVTPDACRTPSNSTTRRFASANFHCPRPASFREQGVSFCSRKMGV